MTKLDKLLILTQIGLSSYKSKRGPVTDSSFNLLFVTTTFNDLLEAIDRIDTTLLPEDVGQAAREYILWQDEQLPDRPTWF